MKKDVIYSVAGILLSVAIFAFLAARLEDPGLLRWESDILLSMRNPDDPNDPIGSKRAEEMLIDMSAMGSTVLLTVLVGTVLGILALNRKWGTALYLLITISLGAALSICLKGVFERPRPDVVEPLALVGFSSFPSGHVMSATIVYLSLALALAEWQRNRRVKIFSLFAAILILILIGIGRVYTAVHWPTDNIGGYAGGMAWLLFWRLIKNHTRLRNAIERWDRI